MARIAHALIMGVEPPIAKLPGSAPGGLAFALGKISPRSFSECVDLTPSLIEKLQGEFAVLMKNAAKAPRMSRKSFVEWGKALRYWWHERFLPVLEGILDAVKFLEESVFARGARTYSFWLLRKCARQRRSFGRSMRHSSGSGLRAPRRS